MQLEEASPPGWTLCLMADETKLKCKTAENREDVEKTILSNDSLLGQCLKTRSAPKGETSPSN